MTHKRKPPTIADVAALAGVSAQTVSNYLTGRFKPRGQNLQRLENAISELGYRPSAAARALRLKQSGMIAMLLEDGADLSDERIREGWEPLHAMFLYGATNRARELGFYVTPVLTRQGGAEMEAIRLVREGRADALICSTEMMPEARLEHLQQIARTEKVPIAMLQENRKRDFICSVSAADEQGGEQAAQHLAALGHTHVAIMTVKPIWPGPVRRRSGFETAAQNLGLAVEVWEAEHYTMEAVRRRAAVDLVSQNRPTAVFAVNDVIAIAVMQQAIELRLNIPKDISILGFNDLDIATYVRPALTTIRTPAAAMGARAVEVLVDAISGQPLASSALLPIEFVSRQSTGAAPNTSCVRTTV
ncbi:LacI family transcriptional regulator [Pararhizobium sp. YC-54]|uniref:LacI family DNA-binding transcriptional regulator n=1 Tax=Pararhizobium sp. YC-54 TaxID=2986920 RepID=UPI0021F6AE06|nr:LacI family DNA-binding transcriptional regulator [Pararhizobium sp. YC-54]MCW0001068.1 LacI family transcriptional regulator [Pararhizobium sp. YC-54]